MRPNLLHVNLDLPELLLHPLDPGSLLAAHVAQQADQQGEQGFQSIVQRHPDRGRWWLLVVLRHFDVHSSFAISKCIPSARLKWPPQ